MARVYATIEEAPGITDAQLKRASLAVDAALVGAIYATDTDGMPTADSVIDALKDATIYQAQAIAKAETSTPTDRLKSASLGKASYSYGDATPGGIDLPAGGGLCPDAATALRVAGLLPVGVILYG